MGDARQIVATLQQIVQWLRGRCAAVVVLTLPPVARAAHNSVHWRIVNFVNHWIAEQSCGKLVTLSILNEQNLMISSISTQTTWCRSKFTASSFVGNGASSTVFSKGK